VIVLKEKMKEAYARDITSIYNNPLYYLLIFLCPNTRIPLPSTFGLSS
jgi:hypothetical protein